MSDDLKIDYVEFTSLDMPASTAFFAAAFGWTFNDYGPDYQEIANGGVDGGIALGADETPPLVIVKAQDLEAARDKVIAAGGVITEDIYGFPGGRRFHFREPGGTVLAIWAEV